MKKQVIVVGGGAAGFFAALNIAEKCPDYRVVILEKTNKVLSKVKVSGGGRCNVTHACFDPRELVKNYPRGEKELRGPFHQFMTGDTIAWFSEKGVELKIEDDGRMFPVTDRSQTIIDCFLEQARKLGVPVKLSTEVISVTKSGKFKLELNNGGTITADYLVYATGGNAKQKHYSLIEQLGHSIVAPIPSLFTFNLKKHSSNALMGLALPATVKILDSTFEEYGSVLFTHWGMSGPAILKLSSKAAQLLHDKSYQFNYTVCWLDNAMEEIARMRKLASKRKLLSSKVGEFPNRFWEYVLNRSKVDAQKNWADLNKQEIERLTKVLNDDVYSANGKTTFKEEFVTCGGIELKEINMKTMESKLVSDLYFCGEVINIDALTGGFNFQAAWTGGFLVAESISKKYLAEKMEH